ncbi:AB-hydrolase YheT [Auriscalpium vulgare]|uniref:AB-hydrolase YheT n=1 Tax=Auriscalpium vulgare TaxID=40419 RepID=A0ACB8SCV9_9AGAM|nr:AB-hydrolase YheT [Auriscalpium vulgare]
MGSILSISLSQLPKVYFAQTSAYLPLKHGADKTSLRELVHKHCLSLFAEYQPAWWLFNGHLQTAYSAVGDFSHVDEVVYERTLLRLKEGGTLGLDFTPPTSERELPDDTPVIVVLHGLSGGSHESYVRAVLAPAISPVEEGGLGYRAVVVNFRGCAGVPLTSSRLYSAATTDDIRQAVIYISSLYPNAPLIAMGFSLGANVLTTYVAEEGEACRLTSAAVLGCPWDMEKNGHSLHNSWFRRSVYSKGMGGNLRKLVMRHLSTIAKFPDPTLAKATAEILAKKSFTLVEFDGTVTRRVGGPSPPFPLANAWEYYRWCASHKCLPDIRIPFIGINADDDPIVENVPTDLLENEWVTLVVTRGGGHLGWFEAPDGFRGGMRRWVRRPLLEWFRATAEEVALEGRKYAEVSVVDGWLVEAGREDLGSKVIEKGGRVEGAEGEDGLIAGL